MAEVAMEEPRKGPEQADPTRFMLAETARNEWVFNAELNTQPEQLTDPAYWSHVSQKLRPYDRIEVRVDDGTWFAELVVLEAARNWATVRMLNVYRLDTQDISQTRVAQIKDQYRVEWKGPQNKFCVIRVKDAQYLHKGAETRKVAEQWLENYEASIER